MVEGASLQVGFFVVLAEGFLDGLEVELGRLGQMHQSSGCCEDP